jgi:hypothetical protein
LLIVVIYLFFYRANVHANIPLLLSSRHGVSPGAKKVGEVMWLSPPLSFAAPLPRCRDFSLPVVPSSFAGFLISWDALRWRRRLYSDTVGDSMPMESWSVKGSSRQWRVVEPLGSVAERLCVDRRTWDARLWKIEDT